MASRITRLTKLYTFFLQFTFICMFVLAIQSPLSSAISISGYLQTPDLEQVSSAQADLGIKTKPEKIDPSRFALACAGNLDYSNKDGYFSLPKHHKKESVRLVIIPLDQLSLNLVKGETASDMTAKSDNYTAYNFEKKEDNEKCWYWEVTKTDLAENKKVRSYDLILFADPKDIFVKTGIYMATDSEQNILPNVIYVLHSNPIDIMNKQKYFDMVAAESKQDGDVQKVIQEA